MTNTCTATTKSGRPCRALPINWPYGLDGNPHLCAKHAPRHLRELRDTVFAEQRRRQVARLDARDPECWSWHPEIPLDYLADEYGWSAEHFTPLFQEGDEQALRLAFDAWHRRRCAVCGSRALHLVDDHDHDSGLIRGLLCRSCNGREPHDNGLFRKYRERPPAQILGIRLRYWDPFNGWAKPRVIDPNRLDNHPAYALAAKLAGRLQAGGGR